MADYQLTGLNWGKTHVRKGTRKIRCIGRYTRSLENNSGSPIRYTHMSREVRFCILIRRKSSSRWVLRRFDSGGVRVINHVVLEGGLSVEEAQNVAQTMFQMEMPNARPVQ